MLSFTNKDNEKKPICVIKNNDKIIENVYLYDKIDKSFEGFESLELVDSFHFQIVPDLNKERDVLFIASQSGAGKSFYCKEYLKEYVKLKPKNKIYLFSYLDKDETIDEVKKLQRINIYDKEFMNEEIEPNEFKDSAIILDDIEMISDKKLKNKIMDFFNKLLMVGRHYNCTTIWVAHEVANGHSTKIILNECNSLTIFPRVIGNKKLKYVLESYFGLDKEQVNKIKSLDSRAVTIKKSYPKIVISEKNIFII